MCRAFRVHFFDPPCIYRILSYSFRKSIKLTSRPNVVSRICTARCYAGSNFCKSFPVFVLWTATFSYPTPLQPKICRCSSWTRLIMLMVAESEDRSLKMRVIIFEVTHARPIWGPQYLNVTDRHTDGLTDRRLLMHDNTALCEASRGKKTAHEKFPRASSKKMQQRQQQQRTGPSGMGWDCVDVDELNAVCRQCRERRQCGRAETSGRQTSALRRSRAGQMIHVMIYSRVNRGNTSRHDTSVFPWTLQLLQLVE